MTTTYYFEIPSAFVKSAESDQQEQHFQYYYLPENYRRFKISLLSNRIWEESTRGVWYVKHRAMPVADAKVDVEEFMSIKLKAQNGCGLMYANLSPAIFS